MARGACPPSAILFDGLQLWDISSWPGALVMSGPDSFGRCRPSIPCPVLACPSPLGLLWVILCAAGAVPVASFGLASPSPPLLSFISCRLLARVFNRVVDTSFPSVVAGLIFRCAFLAACSESLFCPSPLFCLPSLPRLFSGVLPRGGHLRRLCRWSSPGGGCALWHSFAWPECGVLRTGRYGVGWFGAAFGLLCVGSPSWRVARVRLLFCGLLVGAGAPFPLEQFCCSVVVCLCLVSSFARTLRFTVVRWLQGAPAAQSAFLLSSSRRILTPASSWFIVVPPGRFPCPSTALRSSSPAYFLSPVSPR